jgi:beta-lactamase class A
MIIDSDNGAQNLLLEHINTKIFDQLFDLMQLDGPQKGHYYISAKQYAFFLRTLYNGSYLGSETSEQLLEILEKVAFPYGLKKGVPEGVPVIHKFGSVNLVDQKTQTHIIGFHDCGIVYFPEKPYIVCMMSLGNNQEKLASLIEHVSAYLFNYTSKEN